MHSCRYNKDKCIVCPNVILFIKSTKEISFLNSLTKIMFRYDGQRLANFEKKNSSNCKVSTNCLWKKTY